MHYKNIYTGNSCSQAIPLSIAAILLFSITACL
jgi:hypothetical protein